MGFFQIEGEHAKDCSIELDPVKGFIHPREEKSITINFVADRSVSFIYYLKLTFR
jgi:hypothetical protein